VKIHVGEQVTAGQVTITLDKSGASSQYFQAEANFKNAEKTLERMKSLYAEGAISAQTLDGTQTAYDVASANFQAARGSVDLASPVSGQVTAVNVNVGDLPVPGMVLATVAKIGRMKVIFNINESDLSNIAVGQSVEVYSEARPSALLEGRVIQTSKSADIRSRSFELKAIFQNSPDRWFKPGMYVKVRARLSPRANALVIPAGAVVSDGVTNRVFLIRSGRAYQKAVTLGVSDGERTEVLGGLALLDTVATTGVTNLKDSSFVNVVLTK
jgi:RND family efflux transporter MFP subunit